MDKNSILFYKAQFTVTAIAGDDTYDLLWQIVQHIRGWIIHKWNKKDQNVLRPEFSYWSKLKHGGKIYTDNNVVFIESEYLRDEETGEIDWACRIVENFELKDGTSPRQWVTDIGFEQGTYNSARISYVVSYSNRAQFIGPYQPTPSPSVPNLIYRILSDGSLKCSIGNDPIGTTALELKVGNWLDFMQRVNDDQRIMPFFFISPTSQFHQDGSPVFLIDPQKLQSILSGTAQVYYTTDSELLEEALYLNPDYACYDGAFHMYLPRGRHRWFGAEDIETYGADQMMLFIRHAFVENVNYFDDYFLMEECRQKKLLLDNRLRMDELRRRHEETANDLDKMETDFIEASDLALHWERKYHIAIAERDNFMAINKEYQKKFDERRDSGNKSQNEDGRVIVLPDMPTLIDRKIDLADVIGYFRFAFADRMAFTDKVLVGCILSPQELWKYLYALGTQMVDLYRKPGIGDIYMKFHQATGIEVGRGQGHQTRDNARLKQLYKLNWNGETLNIEPHLKCPRSQRIYFDYSQESQRLVIGQIGEHIENATTRKL